MRCEKQNAKSSRSEKSGAICLQLCKMQEKVPLFLLDRLLTCTVTFTGLRLERQTKTFAPETMQGKSAAEFQSGYGCNNFKSFIYRCVGKGQHVLVHGAGI